MTDSEFLLFVLEAARPHQVDALLALSEAKGVLLAELIAQVIDSWLDKEL